MARNQPHQDLVVDAAIALLARLEVGSVGPVGRPDTENRSTPDVDGTVLIGDRPFALEHTRVEQFPDALSRTAELRATEAEWASFRADFIKRVRTAGSFNVDVLELDVPRRRIRAFLAAAAVALAEAANSLVAAGGGTYANVSMIPVRQGSSHAVFRIVRGFDPEGITVSADIRFLHRFTEKGEVGDRVAVLDRLLAAKMKKLDSYAATHRTVLVLEDHAFIASPIRLLLLAAQRLRSTLTSTPEYLIVVSCEDDIWSLQYIRRSDALSREIFRTNWWLMDPVTRMLVWRPWGESSRQTLHAALALQRDAQS